MKIRFLHSIAGGINFNPGDVGEIPDAEAKRLIAAGIAEAVVVAGKRVSPLETAVSPAATVERVAIIPDAAKVKAK